MLILLFAIMEIVVATANMHKLQEIRKILPKSCILHTLLDVGITQEIPETGDTFSKNALIKAEYVYNTTGLNSLADDSGLEVTSLNNEPGVYSARYAGLPVTHQKNIDKLLYNLHGKSDRYARFVSVLCFKNSTGVFYFEGAIEGSIANEQMGNNGFGYDPVFIPKGYLKTFAEMSDYEKNAISHRAIALGKFQEWLRLQQ